MAFVLSQTPTYSWPVNYEMPVDGGKFRRVSFEIIFKRLPQTRVEEILAQQQQLMRAAERGDSNLMELLGQARQHAAETMAGWNGVKQTDDGEDLAFTAARCKEFLDVPGMAATVLQAFGESLKLGKEKN
jgi:hypothetical protein